jgi:putative membrane protein
MPDSPSEAKSFWIEAFTWRGAASWRVLPTTLAFSAFATIVYLLHCYLNNYYHEEINLAVEVGPHEIAGALLGLLLVMRTNAGYDRWWEARKLWGGIINQSRNLALTALAQGPAERRWRESIVHWTIAFAYATKARLRGDREVPELRPLLGKEQAERVRAAEHVPYRVALKISELLREGCERGGMDRFAFWQAERERSGLIDHLGGCERIRNTPLATLYSITIRSFIVLFLFTLPFALLHKFGAEWLAPLATTVVAWAVLALDRIGVELQQPFSTNSLSHLPLNEICHTIEKNLLALLDEANGRVSAEERFTDPKPGAGI